MSKTKIITFVKVKPVILLLHSGQAVGWAIFSGLSHSVEGEVPFYSNLILT